MSERHHPVRDEHLDTRLRCPRDAQRMEREKLGEVTIDRCAGCGAIWLDHGEVERLLADTKLVIAADIGVSGPRTRGASLGEVLCPRDKTVLKLTNHPQQSHIEVDSCPTCRGMLLDAGELKDMDEFTLMERLRALMGSMKPD